MSSASSTCCAIQSAIRVEDTQTQTHQHNVRRDPGRGGRGGISTFDKLHTTKRKKLATFPGKIMQRIIFCSAGVTKSGTGCGACVLQVGSQLSSKTFNHLYERVCRLQQVNIQGQQRSVHLKFTRSYPLENNEWGDFQVRSWGRGRLPGMELGGGDFQASRYGGGDFQVRSQGVAQVRSWGGGNFQARRG